jgi:pimeloyl-ACP methyl ester carboxylesterase
LWPLFEHLKSTPMLAIRGGLSDILSADTLERMTASHPDCSSLTLPNRGHAPMLDEPPAVAAIEAFLRRLEHVPKS